MPISLRFGRLALLAALSGCTTWVKPGTTDAMRDAQLARCRSVSYRQAPSAPVTVMTDAGGWKPAEENCWKDHGVKKCETTDAHYEPPTYATQDANDDARDAFFDECMFNAGWTKQ